MEGIEVIILNWEKYHKRSDIKYPSWFRVQNTICSSESLYGLTEAERWGWICLLCLASRKNSNKISFKVPWFCEEFRLDAKVLENTLKKLSLNGCVEFTPRTRRATLHYTTNTTDTCTWSALPAPVPVADKVSLLDLESVYTEYPKKVGKKAGLKIAVRVIKTLDDMHKLRLAIHAYKQYLEKERTEAKFIKHFSTFMNSWTDWLDRDVGSSGRNKVEVVKVSISDAPMVFDSQGNYNER